jgi:hypothetical protein
MKISHRDVEGCLKDPAGWMAEQAAEKYFRIGYDQLLRFAIYHFHDTGDATAGRSHLEAALESNDLRKAARVEKAVSDFDSYAIWTTDEGLVVIDRNFRINHEFPDSLALGGQISRIDYTPSGYRAVLLGNHDPNWRTELRFPLIQRAISEQFKRPVGEIAVGCQLLDGSGLEVEVYNPPGLTEAEGEFRALAKRLEQQGD